MSMGKELAHGLPRREEKTATSGRTRGPGKMGNPTAEEVLALSIKMTGTMGRGSMGSDLARATGPIGRKSPIEVASKTTSETARELKPRKKEKKRVTSGRGKKMKKTDMEREPGKTGPFKKPTQSLFGTMKVKLFKDTSVSGLITQQTATV